MVAVSVSLFVSVSASVSLYHGKFGSKHEAWQVALLPETACFQAIENVSQRGEDVLAHVEIVAKLENIIAMIRDEKNYAAALHPSGNLTEVEAAFDLVVESSQQSFNGSFSFATENLGSWLKNALSSPTAPDPRIHDFAAFKILMNQVTSVKVRWQADKSVPQTLQMLRDWQEKMECFAEDHSRMLRQGVDDRLSKLRVLSSPRNIPFTVPWSNVALANKGGKMPTNSM